jgi:hypothetical protein
MDLKETDRDLLRRYADQLVSQDAKRRLSLLQEESEQKAKRIRRDAEQEIAAHPERAAEIQEKHYQHLQDLYRVFWQSVAPEMLAWFSQQDFHVVYSYMKEIWPLNEILRNHMPSWRQRLVLEYPDYWLVHAQGQTGNLRESTIQDLLNEAKQGSGPRSRLPSEQDAMYLLYQKARRLTRFLSKAAADGTMIDRDLPGISPQEVAVVRQIPEARQYETLLSGGRHTVLVVSKLHQADDDDEPDDRLINIVWFDLGRRQSYSTGDVLLPKSISSVPSVTLGENALLLRWNEDEETERINVFNLNTGEWIFRKPVLVGASLNDHETKILGMSRANVVYLKLRDEDDDDGDDEEFGPFPMLLSELIAWIKSGMQSPPDVEEESNGNEVLALRTGIMAFPAEVFLDPSLTGKFEIFGRWVPRAPLKGMQQQEGMEIVDFNFQNSYARPLLMRYGPKSSYTRTGGIYLTDGINVRLGEKGDVLSPEEIMDPPPAEHLRRYEVNLDTVRGERFDMSKVLLRDRSDEIHSSSAMLRLKLEPPVQEIPPQALRLMGVSVMANYIVQFLPLDGRVLIYDLWDLYKTHRESEEEREYPLLSKPLVVKHKKALCNVCSAPARGVCSDCKQISYCSAQCAKDDLGEHMVACVNKS